MKKKLLASVQAALLFLALTGCSTTLGTNTSTYFSEMSEKFGLWMSNLSLDLSETDSHGEESPEVDDGKIALDSPANWSVDENGNYTFDGVDGANYYIIYLYDSQDESGSYAFMSSNLNEDGSGTYTGALSDLFDYCYGLYDAEVVAYPVVGATDYKYSEPAVCSFSVTGEVPEASVGYLWDCFTGTLSVELLNIEEYSASAYPTLVSVTFTNQADSSDSVTLSFENASIEDDVFSASTQEVTPDATYDVSASVTWNTEIVTNSEMTVNLGSVTTASDKNAMTEGYGYLNSDIYLSMDYPMVVTDFDPEVGGSAGTWYFFINAFVTNKGVSIPTTFKDCLNFQGEKGGMGADYHDGEDVEFNVTPTTTSAGSAYSYTLEVSGPRNVISMFDGFFYNDMPAGTGSLELYTDGTFLMTIDPPSGDSDGIGSRGISGSSISGLWVENGDGTLTLSYDHTSTTLSE